MKHLYNFATILCTLPFALAACDTQPTNTTDSKASTGSADSGSIPSSDGTGGEKDAVSGNDATSADMIPSSDGTGVGKPDTFTIKGKTPDDKLVTFYVFVNECPKMDVFKKGDLGKFGKKFENVMDFTFFDNTFSTDQSYCVFADRANYMFAYKKIVPTASDSGKILELAWSAGEWGLAPNGDYESEDGLQKKTLKTSVKNGKLVISGIAAIEFPLTAYNKWVYEDEKYSSNGEISDDLTKVTFYYKAKPTSKEFSGTVLRK